MGASVPARAAFSAHTVPAASAYEFSRKYVVEYLFLAAGGDLILLVNCVHLIPKLLCNDGRENVIVFRSLMFYDAYIPFIVQDDIDVFVVDILVVFAADIVRLQIFRYRYGFVSAGILTKNLPHDFRLRFVYDVLLILNDIAIRRSSSGGVAFEPAFPQTAIDFLFLVFGEIFVEPFDDGKKELAFGGVGDILHSGYEFHVVVGQFLSVDDGFVLVACEFV